MKKMMMLVIALALAGTVNAAETTASAAQEEMNAAGVASCKLNCPQQPTAAPPATRAPAPPATKPEPKKTTKGPVKPSRPPVPEGGFEGTIGDVPVVVKPVKPVKPAREEDDGLGDILKGWKPKYGASAIWGIDNFGGLAANLELTSPGRLSRWALTADVGWVRLMNERIEHAGLRDQDRILAFAGGMYRLKGTNFRVGAHTGWIGRFSPHRSSARIIGGVVDYAFGNFKLAANLDHNTIDPIREKRLQPVIDYGFVPSFAFKASW